MNLRITEEEVKDLLENGVSPEFADKLRATLEFYPQLQGISGLIDQIPDSGSEGHAAAVKNIDARLNALRDDIRNIDGRGRLLMPEWQRLRAVLDFLR